MKIVRTIKEMQQLALVNKKEKNSIGFVPTMGFLHEGHQRLLQEGRKKNDVLVMSIFVNPLQFGPNEDFDRYPRDEEHDRKIAEKEKVDILFIPSVEEMYPRPLSIKMDIKDRVNVLCGRSRDGHFEGVITVLTKLFHIILPDQIYFGLKDAQQVAVVDALIKELNFPIKIIPVPTVREEDGLAKSSRNVYLSDEERNEAKFLFEGLKYGQKLVTNGEKSRKKIESEVTQFIKSHTHGKIEYVELLTYPSLGQVDQVNQRVILATAVKFKRARLIDNFIFDESGQLAYHF